MGMKIYNHFLPSAKTKSLNLFLSLMSCAHYYTRIKLTSSIWLLPAFLLIGASFVIARAKRSNLVANVESATVRARNLT